MAETFTNGFCLKLNDLLEPEQIKSVRELLDIYTMGFEIKPITTELTVTDYQLPQAYHIFMASKEHDGLMKSGTREQYRLCLESMLYRLQMPLDKITINHLRLYIHEISTNRKTGKPLAKATLNQRKAIIRSFFKWLYEEEYISKDPSTRIKSERNCSKPKTAFKDTQIEALRMACDTKRTRAIVDLLYSSGIRISECTGLNVSDVDLDSREIIVYGKGEKWRTTFIDAPAVVSLKTYLASRSDDNPALFVSEREPHDRIKPNGIRKMLRKLSEKAGVPDVTPHKFRHSFATAAIEHGMPIESVQTILGHTEISTTTHYAHVSTDKIRRDHKTYMG